MFISALKFQERVTRTCCSVEVASDQTATYQEHAEMQYAIGLCSRTQFTAYVEAIACNCVEWFCRSYRLKNFQSLRGIVRGRGL